VAIGLDDPLSAQRLNMKITLKSKTYHVLIEKDEDEGYVGPVPEIKGCYSQADDLKTLRERMREAIGLCLEADLDPNEYYTTLPANDEIIKGKLLKKILNDCGLTYADLDRLLK